MAATRGDPSLIAEEKPISDETWKALEIQENLVHLFNLEAEGVLSIQPIYDEQHRPAALSLTWDEAEVDRRLAVLEQAGVDPDVLDEIRAWHAGRRKRLLELPKEKVTDG